MTPFRLGLVVLATIVAAISGCLSANSPRVQEQLKIVSAGHTGCMPEDNVLSNVVANPDGSGTWNATCKGKAYLCSAVRSVGGDESYSCALVAQ
jgi:hypothetical protein